MPNLKAIRKRISSVKSTQQITKAMKMVAAAKLRRAQEAIVQARPRTRPVNVTNGPDGRSYSFQVWDWAEDGRSYELDHFIVHEAEDGWETAHGRCRYRAVLRNELSDAVRQAGFEQVTWHQPSDSGYMQQVLTALAG